MPAPDQQGRCPHRPMTAGTTLAVAFLISGGQSLTHARARIHSPILLFLLPLLLHLLILLRLGLPGVALPCLPLTGPGLHCLNTKGPPRVPWNTKGPSPVYYGSRYCSRFRYCYCYCIRYCYCYCSLPLQGRLHFASLCREWLLTMINKSNCFGWVGFARCQENIPLTCTALNIKWSIVQFCGR